MYTVQTINTTTQYTITSNGTPSPFQAMKSATITRNQEESPLQVGVSPLWGHILESKDAEDVFFAGCDDLLRVPSVRATIVVS